MSCSRARSSPAYKPSLVSTARPATTAARSGSRSIVSRKAPTSAASGFHSTYSGGSKAGKRLISAFPVEDQGEAEIRRFPAFDPPEYVEWKPDAALVRAFRETIERDPERAAV